MYVGVEDDGQQEGFTARTRRCFFIPVNYFHRVHFFCVQESQADLLSAPRIEVCDRISTLSHHLATVTSAVDPRPTRY